jgi:hypothetical protein
MKGYGLTFTVGRGTEVGELVWASVWFEMCWEPIGIRKCIFGNAGYDEMHSFFTPLFSRSERWHTHVANY